MNKLIQINCLSQKAKTPKLKHAYFSNIKINNKSFDIFYSTPGMTYSKLIQTLPAPAVVNLTPKTTNRNREARAGQYTWWSIVAESLKMKNQTVPLYIPRQVKDSRIKEPRDQNRDVTFPAKRHVSAKTRGNRGRHQKNFKRNNEIVHCGQYVVK